MAKQIKNGKLPASVRSLNDDLNLFGSTSILDIDEALKSHMESKGMTLRWINATEFKKAGGFNGKGWTPVRTADVGEKILQSSGMSFGATAEGFIVRNDLMLACRRQELTDKHVRVLKAKADMAAGKQRSNADGIREQLGKYGRVIEGYEENGDE